MLLQHLAGTQNTGPGPSCCHHHNERPASTSRSRTRTRSSDNVAIFVHHKWNVNSLRRPTSVRIDSSKPRTDTGKRVDTPALPTLPAPSSPRCRPVALSPHVPPPLTHEIRPQRYQKKARGRPAAPPFTPVFFYLPPTQLIITTTLAGVAQSVEHLFCKQAVSGSSPLASSNRWLESVSELRISQISRRVARVAKGSRL